jgi:hypothetical protein
MAVPEIHPDDKPYWDAAAQGRLLVKRCDACGEYHHYPRKLCPYCMSERTSWNEAKGTGTIYSYSVTRRSGPVPYVIAYVTLDEGPTMMTNIVDCDLDTVRIDQKVKVVFKLSGDQDMSGPPVPCFAPAG